MRSAMCAVLTAAALSGLLSACASHPDVAAGGARSSSALTTTAPISAPSAAPPPVATTTAAMPTPTRTTSVHQIEASSQTAIEKIIGTQPKGGVSVAALDPATGARYSAGAASGMRTASAYKLLVLVALAMRDGSINGERATAARAIENSDNVAGYSLFEAAGGNSGIQSALGKLGMTHTVPGRSDPTFTTTSGRDYVKLLKALVGKGPVSASSRSTILGLMRDVEADQRWGVGVVADKGTTFANKNGWLSIDDSNRPGETDGGLWAVTSVGVVTVAHHQVLMAVFTQHQKSYGAGVTLVQKLARDLVRTVVPSAG